MTEDRITFNCIDCGFTASIDQNNPPNDDDMLSCLNCGREFGKFGIVKAAMIEAAKAEVDKITERHLGKGNKPKWK